MVITGNLIALVLFAIVSLVVLFFLGKRILRAVKNGQSVTQ
jgi:uncharacterized protein HemY